MSIRANPLKASSSSAETTIVTAFLTATTASTPRSFEEEEHCTTNILSLHRNFDSLLGANKIALSP